MEGGMGRGIRRENVLGTTRLEEICLSGTTGRVAMVSTMRQWIEMGVMGREPGGGRSAKWLHPTSGVSHMLDEAEKLETYRSDFTR
jgi:hypothetical protein